MYPTALTAALAAERQKTYRAEATGVHRTSARHTRASLISARLARPRHPSLASAMGGPVGRIGQALRTLVRPARPAPCGCEG